MKKGERTRRWCFFCVETTWQEVVNKNQSSRCSKCKKVRPKDSAKAWARFRLFGSAVVL